MRRRTLQDDVITLADMARGLGLGILEVDPSRETGYGINYENDVFMIHVHCICMSDDCSWCGTCECPSESTYFLVDGKHVSYNQWMKLYGEITKDLPIDSYEHQEAAKALFERSEFKHDPVCDFCLGEGIYALHGGEPYKGAPNFWYKPRNLKAWCGPGGWEDLEWSARVEKGEREGIFRHCLDSMLDEVRHLWRELRNVS